MSPDKSTIVYYTIVYRPAKKKTRVADRMRKSRDKSRNARVMARTMKEIEELARIRIY